MDQLDFTSRFQLLDRVADGPIETYQALADTGVVVMAHFIPRDLPDLGGFLERVRSLPRAPEGKILEITAHEGRPVVVTKFILEFESLPEWLDGEAAASGSSTADEPAPPPTGDRARAAEPPEPASPPPPPPREPESPPGADASPDADADATPTEPEVGPADVSHDKPADEPGEFTRMFKALNPDAGSGAATRSTTTDPTPAQPASADSTQSGDSAESRAESPAANEPEATQPTADPGTLEDEPAPTPPQDEPGEFTRIFKLSDLQGKGDEGDTSATSDPGSPEGPKRQSPEPPRRSTPEPQTPERPPQDQPSAPPVQPRDGRRASSDGDPSRSRPAPPPPPPPPSFGEGGGAESGTGNRPAARGDSPGRPKSSPDPQSPDSPSSGEGSGPGSFTQEIRRQQPDDARPLGDSTRKGPPGPPRRPDLGGRDTPKSRPESGDRGDSGPSYRSAPPPPPPPGRGGSGSGGAPPPPGGQGDWRDRLLDAGDTTGGSSSGGGSGSTAPRPDLPRQDGPSDFTRVIKGMRRPDDMGPGGSRPPSPPSAPSSDKFQPPPSSRPIWPLVLGIVLILLVAIGLVVAFWLMGGSGTEAPVPQ